MVIRNGGRVLEPFLDTVTCRRMTVGPSRVSIYKHSVEMKNRDTFEIMLRALSFFNMSGMPPQYLAARGQCYWHWNAV
jgi:hypothetical protein